MPRYRKKPVEVEAIQWKGSSTTTEVMEFCGTRMDGDLELLNFVPLGFPVPKLWVEANQTYLPIELNEWIIRDRLGLYPCKPDIFAETYEEVR